MLCVILNDKNDWIKWNGSTNQKKVWFLEKLGIFKPVERNCSSIIAIIELLTILKIHNVEYVKMKLDSFD